MTIDLITQEQYNILLNIQKNHKILTFQNKGYEYIDKSKLTESDKEAIKEIESILNSHIKGFYNFNNFLFSKDNELRIRFQYNWNYDNNIGSFKGVGYILLDELLNGFRDNGK